MGSWRGAFPNFTTPSKVGAEGCQEKPQKMPEGEANEAQLARAFVLGLGSIPGTEGREGGPDKPLKALCKQMLGL